MKSNALAVALAAGALALAACARQETPAKSAAAAPSRVEMSRNCLEAHEILMAINPDNIPKFKDVAKFLAEDLKKASGAS